MAAKIVELEQTEFFKAAPAVDTPMADESEQAPAEKAEDDQKVETAPKSKKKKNKSKKPAEPVAQPTPAVVTEE